jgi:phosphoribosylglycinamide formyltransferase 1
LPIGDNEEEKERMSTKIRIGALISGGGTNLQAILDACEFGKIDGEVVFVGSDTPAAAGLGRAEKRGIPTFVVDYDEIIRGFRNKPDEFAPPPDFDLNDIISKSALLPGADSAKAARFFASRAAGEARLVSAMAPYPFDLLVLAGFMRNLTPYFIDRVNTTPDRPRIMNIHPALLPAFPGTDGYGDTFRYGCKVGGCTVHFVDYGEDTGPIIGQRGFQIEEGDTLQTVREKGLKLEWELYPECIRLFAQGRIRTVRMSYALKSGKTAERTVVRILPQP